MKIHDLEHDSWLEFEGHGDLDYRSFTVRAHIDIGHGQFDAVNEDILFSAFEWFVDDLRAFHLDRTKKPRLDGTYDTFIEFFSVGNAVYLRFGIGDTYCGDLSRDFQFRGTLLIDQEWLTVIIDEFAMWAAWA